MSATIGLTRTHRLENGAGLSGTEAFEVEGFPGYSQEISANREEDTAWGAIVARQLKALTMLCDQNVKAQFLGVRYAILATVQAARTITFAGDVSDVIEAGDILRLEGTAAQDGLYEVLTAAGSPTTITLTTGHTDLTSTGAVGTFAKVMSRQRYHIRYTTATMVAGTGVITFAGDISDVFAAGDYVRVSAATANNGIFLVDSVTTDGPPVTTTTLVVNAGTLPDSNPGEFSKIRPAIELIANVPYLWSIEGGQNNPLESEALHTAIRGDVAVLAVNNQTAVAANFQLRAGVDPNLL